MKLAILVVFGLLSAMSVAAVDLMVVQPNTFYLLCYKRDLKCQEAWSELSTAHKTLMTSPKYAVIEKHLVPSLKIVECMMGQHQALCNRLGHNLHELMPPRIKITPPNATQQNNTEEEPIEVYSYTSPMKSDFIIRKLMKFTIPEIVIPYTRA